MDRIVEVAIRCVYNIHSDQMGIANAVSDLHKAAISMNGGEVYWTDYTSEASETSYLLLTNKPINNLQAEILVADMYGEGDRIVTIGETTYIGVE